MNTRFFKFPNMETAFSLAQTHGLTTLDEHNEPTLVRFTNKYAIDVVGVIYLPTGNMIEGPEGLFYPETAPADGWHINVRILDEASNPIPEDFLPYEIFPSTPVRDFA